MLGTDAWLSASCDKRLLPALPEGDQAHEIGHHKKYKLNRREAFADKLT